MNIIRRIFLSLCLLALAYNAMAVAKNPVKSGDWNDPTVWNGGTLPAFGDAVTINGGFTVVVDGKQAEQCASLTIGTAAVVGVLQMGESNPGIYIGAGNLTVGGAVQVAAMGSLEANPSFGGLSFLTINNGGANGLKITAGGYFNMAPSSTDVCDVVFTGTASTITGACTFYSLIVNSSGIVTCASNETVDSNVVVEGGTLAVAATTLSLTSGNVYVGGAPGESIGTGAVTISSGTLSLGDSLTVYSGSSISITTTGKLEPTDVDNLGSISYSATGTFTGGGNIYNNGTLSCKSTIINLTGSIENYGAGTISLTTGQLKPGGALIQESTGSITYTGAGTITTTGDLDISSGSIITTTGLITVGQNLNISGTGAITPTTGGITVTNGNLSLTGTTSNIESSSSAAANITVSNGNLSLSGSASAITLYGAANLDIVKGTSNIGAMCTVTLATGTYTSGSDLTLNGELHFTGAGKLNLAGNYIFNGTYVSDLNTETVTFNGTTNQSISGTSAISLAKLTISNTGVAGSNTVSLGVNAGNSITVLTTFSITNTGCIFDVGSNDFHCQGTMTNANIISGAASFDAESQTVYFDGTVGSITGAQSFTFNNLTINVGSGNTVAETGTHAAPAEIINGNLFIESGALSMVATTIDVGGNFTNNDTFTEGTGTVVMTGAANQTIGGTTATTFYSLTETNTGASGSNIVTLANDITVHANLNVTSGQFSCYVYSITATHTLATATFTLAAGTNFLLGDPTNPASPVPNFPNGFKTYTFAATSTVIYEADAAQIVQDESYVPAAITYGNLDIYTGSASNSTTLSNPIAFIIGGNLNIGDGASLGTATLTGSTTNITVDGNLLVNNNGIYASGTATTFIEGDFTVNNNVGFTPSTGTITMSGTAGLDHTQNINGSGGSQTFYNLTCSNAGAGVSVLLGYPITVNNTLSITVGSLDVSSGNNYQITCNGGFANAITPGLIAEQGTVLFTPAASVNISGAGQTTFYNLNISPAATFSVTVTGTHAAPMEIVGHELNVTSGTFALVGTTLDVDDSVTTLSTSTVTATVGKLSATNDINNAGTITISGAAGNLTSTAGNIYNLNTITFSDAAGANPVLDAVNFFNTSTATLTGGITVANFTGNLYNYSTNPSPASIGFSTGTINVTDSAYIAPSASINFTSTGKLQVTQDINNSGIIAFGGAGTLKALNFYNTTNATLTGLTTIATIRGNLYNLSTTAGSINFSTGTINVTDSVDNISGASITYSGAGKLQATGDIYNNGAITFPVAGVGTLTAANLFANNPGTITMNASTGTISGSTGNGNVTIAGGGSIIYGTGALKLTGNFTDNGTFTEGTGTVTMNSTIANQTISGTASPISFYSLTETNTAPAGSNTVTMQAPIEVDANLDVTSGQFNSYIYAITATHTLATATFTLAAGTTFLIGDPTNPASPVPLFTNNFKTYTFAATSTVIYEADANQTLVNESYVPGAITYGNVDIYTGAASTNTTLSNAIAFNIDGNLTIGDGVSAGTATLGSAGTPITTNINIEDNMVVNNNGAFLPGTGTITMTATAAQNRNQNIDGTASSLTFNTLTIDNLGTTNTSVILGYPITVGGTLTLTKGILDVNSAGNYQLTCNGNFTNNVATTGLNAESGTVVFSPVGAVNIAGTGQTNFFNLEIDPSVGITVQITGTHAAPNEIVGNELSVMAGTFGLRGTTLNVTDSTTVSSGATITGSIAGWTLNSTNDVYSSGNITSSAAGTLTANNLYANAGAMAINTSTVTLSGGGESSNGGVVIASGATITFTSGALNVSGNFTNNNSTAAFTAGTSTTTFNGASTQVIGGTATTTFHNVAISSYNTIITHNENAGGTFTITGSGTFDCGSSSGLTMSVTGLFTNGGTLLGDAGTLALSNSLTNNGTITATNGNINLNGASTTLTNSATGTITGGSSNINFNATTGTLSNSGIITAGSSNINFNAATGTLTNDATTVGTFFNAGTGTVNFNAAGGVLNGTAAISLYNLALTNGVLAITTDLAASPVVINPTITNVLTLTGASSRLNAAAAGDSITMVSTSASSARIAPVTTGAQINLPFTMQRYVGGSLANYEGLASPSQASTLYDWAYDPGFFMSGVGGPDGNAGSFKSVYTIDETTDAYVAVTTTAQALTPGLGLYIYQATTLSSFTPFTFATHGTPSYGVVTFGITDNNTGSNLVGNPYDCPLDWKLLQGDAANAGKLGTQFSVFDRTLGNWESSDGTTASCAGCQLAAAPDIIPEHQGFLVSALSNTNITFNEADKSLTDEKVYKPFTGITKDFVKITLSNNMNGYQGNTAIEFNNKSKASYVLGEDVLYMKSLTEEAPILYTLSSDGKFLNRNLQPMVDGDEQDVMFYAGGNIAGNYTLTFNGIDNLSQFNCIQLEDLRLGKTVQIEEGSSYTYQLDNTGTYKFILHFKKLQPGLPCVITTLANNVTENLDEAVDVYKSQTGVTAKFTLSESQQAIISVYNTLGQKVEQDIVKDVMDEQVDIPLPSTNGMYIIRIETPSGVTTKRIYQ